jgi:hypothetical protein
MNVLQIVNENPRRKKCVRTCDVMVAPRALRFLLGEPSKAEADHYRITGEYHFAVTMSSNNKRHIKYVTVHDWEQTTVFSKENPFTVEKFWGVQQPVTLKVSAIGEREAFIVKGYLETSIDYKVIDTDEGEVKKTRRKPKATDDDMTIVGAPEVKHRRKKNDDIMDSN